MLAETICRIKKTGLMGIVRVETIERGIEIAQGCIDGGVDVLEISYTNNNAGEVIRALKEKFGDQLLVGAAGLMWGHVVVAGPSPGGGLGASRLLPGVTLGLVRIEV